MLVALSHVVTQQALGVETVPGRQVGGQGRSRPLRHVESRAVGIESAALLDVVQALHAVLFGSTKPLRVSLVGAVTPRSLLGGDTYWG